MYTKIPAYSISKQDEGSIARQDSVLFLDFKTAGAIGLTPGGQHRIEFDNTPHEFTRLRVHDDDYYILGDILTFLAVHEKELS